MSLVLARKKKTNSDGGEVVKSSIHIFSKHAGETKLLKVVTNIALSQIR